MVGDIVILPFPYADSEDSKDRPTVLLADVGDGRYADWIVCPVTTSPIAYRREIPIKRDRSEGWQIAPGQQGTPGPTGYFFRK